MFSRLWNLLFRSSTKTEEENAQANQKNEDVLNALEEEHENGESLESIKEPEPVQEPAQESVQEPVQEEATVSEPEPVQEPIEQPDPVETVVEEIIEETIKETIRPPEIVEEQEQPPLQPRQNVFWP